MKKNLPRIFPIKKEIKTTQVNTKVMHFLNTYEKHALLMKHYKRY